MAIQFVEVDKLGKVELLDAELKVLVNEEELEAKYIKCGQSGEVKVAIEDMDDLPIGQMVLLTLKDHDGADSEYQGVISEDGTFVSA